jgi:tetratricopeptide (TPR) repeat protein
MVFVLFVLSVACQVRAEEKGSTYYDLGVFSYESGDYETAEKNLKKALELNPGHPPYHHYLGKTYLKMARYDEAIKHLTQAWSGDPEIPELKYDLAYGHFQLEDYAKAADLFEQLADEDPTHVLSHYYGGVSLYKEKQYSKALDYFLAAAKTSPTIRVNGRYYAGMCYLKMGDNEKAVVELEYVRDNTDSESLKENSMQWLESIAERAKAFKPYVLYAKIGYQYDDNIRYEPLDEDIFSDEDDFLTSLDFAGQYHFVNRADLKCIAGYYHYQTLHNQLDEYDLAESVPNLNVKYLMKPYTFGLNYLYYYYWVDYQRYLRRHRLIPEVSWDINDQFSTHFKYSYYDNEHFQDNRYDGDNHEISLLFDYRHLVDEKEINLIGEIGYEDNNATHPDEYYGRIKFRGSVYFMGPWELRFKVTARYEDKSYDNTDSFFNVKRKDDRYEGSILMAHRFFHDYLNVQVEYTYTKNDSNISFYEYEKNKIGLYLTVTY